MLLVMVHWIMSVDQKLSEIVPPPTNEERVIERIIERWG